MKNIIKIIVLSIVLIPSVVFAGASGSAPGSVENGSSATFTVSISGTAAWNLKLSGSGATSGCSNAFADVTANGGNTSKSFSITCKATSEGTITFTATGDITSADGNNQNVSITKTVSVVKPREKETESRLSSLSVEGYQIDFSKDKDSYSVTVEPSVTSITISATAISKHASISGTGTKELDSDGGKFEITCTAENGTKKTYVINVSVIDKNPINVTIDGNNYTVAKSTKSLTTPTDSTESKVTINDIEVPCYINEKNKLTIIGVKDTDGNIKYAIYDNNNYKLYSETKSSNVLLFINYKYLEGFKEVDLTINNNQYKAFEINDRFKIVYAMNLSTGEYNYYKYDTKEETFQVYEVESKQTKEKNNIIFIITTIVFLITTIGLIVYIIIQNKNSR